MTETTFAGATVGPKGVQPDKLRVIPGTYKSLQGPSTGICEERRTAKRRRTLRDFKLAERWNDEHSKAFLDLL